jgi:hypothetical protein
MIQPNLIHIGIEPGFNLGDPVYLGKDGKIYSNKSRERLFLGHVMQILSRGKKEDKVIISIIPTHLTYAGGNPKMEVCDIISEGE